jgi:hypothetical protein
VGEFGDVIRQVIEAYQRGIAVVVWTEGGRILHSTKGWKYGDPVNLIEAMDATLWSATDCPRIVEAASQLYYLQPATPKNLTCRRGTDSTARKAAKKAGLLITKHRVPRYCNHRDGYQLLDDRCNVVAGVNYELSADEALKFCEQYSTTKS